MELPALHLALAVMRTHVLAQSGQLLNRLRFLLRRERRVKLGHPIQHGRRETVHRRLMLLEEL